ncbi:ammonium transporter [Propionibacteriaceae bacterium ES.041]|uniref:ammonium transporter n=1 Tax=Enemella evansiae TaxID=2016499 RepID=UPI000B95D777|nr:ammonium transporter [Enemella evansiae]OYN94600.1 ammonia channel protein [Enemella evansiae]PFG67662.1 ammonium transporter [Propionibacteriaceae bacterium ES.041]
MTDINTGDTAWVLISAALVLLMTPGLAFFYGGMVRAKSVLNMIMMSVVTMGTIGVTWVLFGYSMAFGNSVGGLGLIGNPFEFLGLKGLAEATTGSEGHLIPALAFVGFQSAFAIIAVALISGAVADRMKFGAWLAFSIVWAILVYFPAAHWVFAFSSDDGAVVGGWIANQIKAIDFAGGTAIHINAGAAALALALVLGKRAGFGKDPMRPHNLTLVMLGAGVLWFGWFGFNAGSALGANGTAAVAWVNTLAATATAMLGWLITEKIRDGHPTSLGAASGVVAGLVAITPACASVDIVGALAIGVIAGVACALAVGLKFRFGLDDSLDVVGVHLVGGLVGTLLIGFFATASVQVGSDEADRVNGLFYGGGLDQLWRQAVGAVAVLIYSFVVSLLIAMALKAIMGLRVSADAESEGIDQAEHAETGYDLNPLGGRLGRGALAHAMASAPPPEPAPAADDDSESTPTSKEAAK